MKESNDCELYMTTPGIKKHLPIFIITGLLSVMIIKGHGMVGNFDCIRNDIIYQLPRLRFFYLGLSDSVMHSKLFRLPKHALKVLTISRHILRRKNSVPASIHLVP